MQRIFNLIPVEVMSQHVQIQLEFQLGLENK